MTTEPVLAVKNLTISFGAEPIIENLSFAVKRAEYLTIIGPNGSGKTTLFKALIGTLPFSGEVVWAPNTVLGYVPQRLDIERSVPLSLRDFLESKTTGKKPDLKKYLAMVNLDPALLKSSLGSLSGGEFQRALVALALIGDTNVLLFDEPTVGIDKPSEEQIYETLHRLQDEKGITIIAISHDLSLVNRYADKVLCLNRRTVCFGVPEEVMNAKNLTDLYGDEHYKFFHHAHGTH